MTKELSIVSKYIINSLISSAQVSTLRTAARLSYQVGLESNSQILIVACNGAKYY